MMLDHQRATERFHRAEERTAERMGYGDTEGALALSEQMLPRITEALEKAKGTKVYRKPKITRFLKHFGGLSTDLVALVIIHRAFSAIRIENGRILSACERVGVGVADELYAAGVSKVLSAKEIAKIERKVRRSYSHLDRRTAAFRREAELAGVMQASDFDTTSERVVLGAWLIENVLMPTLPDVFVQVQIGTETHIGLTPAALQQIDDIGDKCIRQHPSFVPTVEKPADWNGLYHADALSEGGKLPIVRTHHKETRGLVRQAIATGQMQPALDALNSVQRVPFVINQPILELQHRCVALGVELPGFQPSTKFVEGDQSKAEIRRMNLSLTGRRVSLRDDLADADRLKDADSFYTVHSIDFRGRLYAVPYFNFQREDRVRALLLFRDGLPIGEEGLWWLKVHTANCGDFDKVSKRSFEDRVKWVDNRLDWIAKIARAPLAYLDEWSQADKPWLFLAACMELSAAIAAGPEYVTRLPVSWDGTCSGLQHLCAMIRSEEGALVNLTPSDIPQDIYQKVADAVKANVALDAETHPDEEVRAMATLCLASKIDRSLVKRNVMTFAYGSKQYGMRKQLRTDLMVPLHNDVVQGKRDKHPYGEDDGFKASDYLARHTYNAIVNTIEKPAQVMAFLQQIARALAHEGKSVDWVNPAGVPVSNRYHEVLTECLRLWMHDRSVMRVKVAVGYKKEIDKVRSANGIAPNFVHSCDSAHLMLTVNAAVKEGINSLALIHDSFGCLAPQSTALHRIIREQFAQMYEEHDVLGELLERSKCALTSPNWGRLPNAVVPGSLNIRSILDARYAFA